MCAWCTVAGLGTEAAQVQACLAWGAQEGMGGSWALGGVGCQQDPTEGVRGGTCPARMEYPVGVRGVTSEASKGLRPRCQAWALRTQGPQPGWSLRPSQPLTSAYGRRPGRGEVSGSGSPAQASKRGGRVGGHAEVAARVQKCPQPGTTLSSGPAAWEQEAQTLVCRLAAQPGDGPHPKPPWAPACAGVSVQPGLPVPRSALDFTLSWAHLEPLWEPVGPRGACLCCSGAPGVLRAPGAPVTCPLPPDPRFYQEVRERGLNTGQESDDDLLDDPPSPGGPRAVGTPIVVKNFRPPQVTWSQLPEVRARWWGRPFSQPVGGQPRERMPSRGAPLAPHSEPRSAS